MDGGLDLQSKLGAVVVASTAFVPGIVTNALAQPVFSVSVSTIAGAAFGTFAAIGFDDAERTERPRGKLFSLAASTTIISSSLVGVLPDLVHWTWIKGGLESVTAALMSVIVYYVLPEAITAMRKIFRNLKLSDLLPFKRSAAEPTQPPKSDEGKD